MLHALKTFVAPDTPAELFLAMGVGEHARRTGEQAPDVTLIDREGAPVRLRDHWTVGPLIVVFFRGGWCDYCNLQLRDWQMHLTALRQLGATLLAVSPQAPDRSAVSAEENHLAFPVLSDVDLSAADAFGIAFTLPPELVEYFAEIGTDIPVLNGNGLWALPVRATYVIDTQGVVRYADVEPDYRKRPKPTDALLAIEAMR
jgi:peroxiredoxin